MYNKIIVLGNIVRDPSSREIGKDNTVCNFTLASNRKRGENEEVAYIDFAAFGKQAEVIDKHVSKGDRLLVEGRLRTESWETDGNKRSKLSGIVEQFSFANGPKGQNEGSAAQKTLSAATETSSF
jgi:single-strand DNA-binding protein|tara:strand:+ start:2414 stop:2788 length:375 start_codon:yes stop_codon:yes gene_type:complete